MVVINRLVVDRKAARVNGAADLIAPGDTTLQPVGGQHHQQNREDGRHRQENKGHLAPGVHDLRAGRFDGYADGIAARLRLIKLGAEQAGVGRRRLAHGNRRAVAKAHTKPIAARFADSAHKVHQILAVNNRPKALIIRQLPHENNRRTLRDASRAGNRETPPGLAGNRRRTQHHLA